MGEFTTLYRAFDCDGNLLYAGISLSFVTRMGQHNRGSLWFKEVASFSLEHFDTRNDAEEAEANAIVTEAPRFNHALKKCRPPRYEPHRITSAAELRADHDPDGKKTQFLSRGELKQRFGIPSAAASALMQTKDFPRAMRLFTSNTLYWRAHEVQEWLAKRAKGETLRC